jgi:hypothetical protein
MTKQKILPGTDMDLDKEIVEAAENYEEFRDKRMDLLKQEVKAKNQLLAVMNEKGLKSYSFENKEVIVTEKEDVKVTKKTKKEE